MEQLNTKMEGINPPVSEEIPDVVLRESYGPLREFLFETYCANRRLGLSDKASAALIEDLYTR
jgi:hypothetical protein